VEVGVTIYSIDPAVASLGFVSVWLIVDPDPALTPLIVPVLVPRVHVKVLLISDVSVIFVLSPEQIVLVFDVVTEGKGFTTTAPVDDAFNVHVEELTVQ
jgi:hypothetical protein